MLVKSLYSRLEMVNYVKKHSLSSYDMLGTHTLFLWWRLQ